VVIKRAIRELEFDTSHLLGQGYNRGDVSGILRENRRTRSLDEILVKASIYHTTAHLKRRLLAAQLLTTAATRATPRPCGEASGS